MYPFAGAKSITEQVRLRQVQPIHAARLASPQSAPENTFFPISGDTEVLREREGHLKELEDRQARWAALEKRLVGAIHGLAAVAMHLQREDKEQIVSDSGF